jgi:hypothetical protein
VQEKGEGKESLKVLETIEDQGSKTISKINAPFFNFLKCFITSKVLL